MFISKAEKSNLYKLIADLQLRVKVLELAKAEVKASSKKPARAKDESYDAYKKQYNQTYYWRKKSERLANGSTEGIRTKKKAEPVAMNVEPLFVLGDPNGERN
jgi:hypothetical protein